MWKELNHIDQLDQIQHDSNESAQVIIKHSTRCIISSTVKKNLESAFSDKGFYILDLLAHRDISNEIATRFGVMHESPQLIVLKEGDVVYHASHHGIDNDAVSAAL